MSSSPILLLHICSGTIGGLSDAAAVSFRKGSPRHRTAGNVFVIAMVSLGTTAVYLALMKSQMTNIFRGVLTFYLAATSWMTVRRRERKPGVFDWIALLAALTVGAVIMTYGFQAAHSPRGLKAGVPRRDVFLPWFHSPAGCRGRRPHARPWRYLRHATSDAASLAYVLCAVHRLSFHIHSAATSVSRFVSQDRATFSAGYWAADIDDFLAGSRPLLKSV
jgi:hypothetical protein